MTTHYNYVAYFPSSGRIKIGITANPDRRWAEYRQEAGRHGLGSVSFCKGRKQSCGVARMVEQSIRDSLKHVAVHSSREWFAGDPETFVAFIDMTTRLQRETCALLVAEVAHA